MNMHGQKRFGLLFHAAILLLLAGLHLQASGQTVVFGGSAPGSAELTIRGTSTLHDWEVKGDIVKGAVTLAPADAPDAVNLSAAFLAATPRVNVEIPVQSLESGKRMMNREMFKAMKAEQHKLIAYRLTSVAPAESKPDGDAENVLAVVAQGELTICGKTRSVEFPVTIGGGDKGLNIKGETTLKMTDFGIDPPRLMMGALRVGDEITVKFEWSPSRLEE